MSQTSNSQPQPSSPGQRSEGSTPEPAPGGGSPARPSGRYRFCSGQPVDPEEGVHPEMRTAVDAAAAPHGGSQADAADAIPASPAALIALQDAASLPRQDKPENLASASVLQVMELIDRLDTRPVDDLEIAYRLVRRLEMYHDQVTGELRDDEQASHSQLVAWAVDAERLMQARHLLGAVHLE